MLEGGIDLGVRDWSVWGRHDSDGRGEGVLSVGVDLVAG